MLQEPIVLILISLLRSCCGGPFSPFHHFGIFRSQCLARTYRCILLLAASLSNQPHVDKLLREVHEILNKTEHGNHETELEIFLQWVAVSGKLLSQNDSSICSTLYSAAISHLTLLPTNVEVIPNLMFEMKQQQRSCRSVCVLSGLNHKNVLTMFPSSHLNRVFSSERQTLFLDQTFCDIKLLLR
jgi:hypothetical protein